MLLVVSAGCWGDCVEIVFFMVFLLRGRGRGRQLNWSSYIELARLARVRVRGAF